MRYLKLHTVIRRNAKVADLDYGDRWAYIESLVAAKEADPEGEWINEDDYRVSVSPETYERLPLLERVGLVTRDSDGRLRIGQWRMWQYDVEHVPAIDLLARDASLLKAHRERDAKRKREERAAARAAKRAAERPEKRPRRHPRTGPENPSSTHETSTDASTDSHGRERNSSFSLQDGTDANASVPVLPNASGRRCGDCHTPLPADGSHCRKCTVL